MKNRAKSNPDLRVLGIDPGSVHCGYGVISLHGSHPVYVASGRITPRQSAALHIRLRDIHDSLSEIVREFSPDVVVVERIFFAKGIRAALSLGHARGIALLAAACAGVEFCEFSALEVKKAVVGYGRAEKRQVQDMVRVLLGIRGSLYPDSADALALALCYANTLKFRHAVEQSG